MNKLWFFFKRDHSFSVWDLMLFLGNFLGTYLYNALGIYLSIIAGLSQGIPLTGRHWGIVLLGGIGLVVCTYGRENIITRNKEKRIKGGKIIYDCIGGAIDRLVDLKVQPAEHQEYYPNELLKYIEKVVVLILGDEGIDCGDINTNLMLRKSNPDRLELLFFSTFQSGRSKITLSLTGSPILPGAPEACCYKKAMYITDIRLPAYARFFSEDKPYKSILSVPVMGRNNEVFAVVNIDSDIPQQFVSKDFIDKKILPIIHPLISLIVLEQEVVVRNGHETPQQPQQGVSEHEQQPLKGA